MKAASRNVLLFPGCIIQNRLPFLEKSARLVFNKLKFDIEDAPFVCCPDPVGVASISRKTWLTLAARNLTFGEKKNKDILSLCNGCSETLVRANHVLKNRKEALKEVNDILEEKGYKYAGNAKVTHFVRTLVEDIGVKKIKKIVKATWGKGREKHNPIKGLRIAAHPGCHYNRPSVVLTWDNPLDPQYQEKLIKAIGGIPVDYEEKTLCCGSCVARTRNDIGLEIIRTKYKSVTDAGAEAVAVNCPACFQMLESHQREVNKKFDENYDIPIFYITELVALAFGYEPEEIGFKFHTAGKKKVFS
ncbi:MAG: CoB--CoM heterodisulfide reductase iron-sulfur subunit B family protein [Promethearchaeota archaeon]